MTQEKTTKTSIRLFAENGETSRYIHASIDENGDVTVIGQDIGEAPIAHWGDDDYEYWATVKQGDKDKLLLALLKQLYSGNRSAVDDFCNFCQSEGIPFNFETWT
ncbi:MAG TPA: hypothetical protein VK203_14725 [Nostocaceae cyanobacterium]|nr:hypothetical protein [Nostocaceae cyanobacterium]